MPGVLSNRFGSCPPSRPSCVEQICGEVGADPSSHEQICYLDRSLLGASYAANLFDNSPCHEQICFLAPSLPSHEQSCYIGSCWWCHMMHICSSDVGGRGRVGRAMKQIFSTPPCYEHIGYLAPSHPPSHEEIYYMGSCWKCPVKQICSPYGWGEAGYE